MRHLFWQQRGPLAVVHGLRDRLIEGESVVFLAPRWSPDLVDPLIAAMPARRVALIDAGAAIGQPDQLLCAALGLADGRMPPAAASQGPSRSRSFGEPMGPG
jgi:hypothetical protein